MWPWSSKVIDLTGDSEEESSPSQETHLRRPALGPDEDDEPIVVSGRRVRGMARAEVAGSEYSPSRINVHHSAQSSPRPAAQNPRAVVVTQDSPSRRVQSSPSRVKLRPSAEGIGGTPRVDREDKNAHPPLDGEDSQLDENTPPTRLSRRSHRSPQKNVESAAAASPPRTPHGGASQLQSTNMSNSPRTRQGLSTRSTSKQSQSRETSLGALEESLRRFKLEMEEVHAETVSYLLHDAKKANQHSSEFCDDESPFKSLKTVQLRPGQEIPNAAVSQNLESFTIKGKSSNNAKISKAPRSILVAKAFRGNVPRVPKYKSSTLVRRTILSADDEQLKFHPYFEDIDNYENIWGELQDELQLAYPQKPRIESRHMEKVSQLFSHLDRWIEEFNFGVSRRDLEKFLLHQNKKLLEKCRKRLPRSFEHPLNKDIHERAETFTNAFKNVFNLGLEDVLLSNACLQELTETAKAHPTRRSLDQPAPKTPNDALETYATLGCLICSVVDCPTHGDYVWEPVPEGEEEIDGSDLEDSSNLEDSSPKLRQVQHRHMIPTDDLLRIYKENISKRQGEPYSSRTRPKACSPDCYLTNRSQHATINVWPSKLKNDLRQVLIWMTDTPHRSCEISLFLDAPCWQVFREIQAHNERQEFTDAEQPTYSSPEERPKWYDNRRKILTGDWSSVTNAHLQHTREQMDTCAHPGPCTSECPCVAADILCESICFCPDDCPRRFTGCSCESSSEQCCTLDTCICIQMSRECGPECSSCGAVPRLDPEVRHDDNLFATGCQNVSIQRGVGKKLVMGESQLEGSGYGLYTAEAIPKGCFISEYMGELISDSEAERRGIIYDRKLMSFLFSLNGEKTIDGFRFANKTRYINHAEKEKDGLNCGAAVYLVNGEQRIKFYALRDIKVGEELLFNYGENFAKKHGLNKKLANTKDVAKKGVAVRQGSSDDLSNVNANPQVARGRATAIRGGHRGGRRGTRDKAGKKGSTRCHDAEPERDTEMDVDGDPMDVLFPSPEAFPFPNIQTEGEYDEFEDEDEDEDEDEENLPSHRPQRTRSRPLRYTR